MIPSKNEFSILHPVQVNDKLVKLQQIQTQIENEYMEY